VGPPVLPPAEPLGSWQGDWGLDTQQELSVAVQPSEGGHFQNPLTTAASFTDQHSMAGSRKDGLLTSRTLYDVDGRYPLFTSPVAPPPSPPPPLPFVASDVTLILLGWQILRLSLSLHSTSIQYILES